MKNYNDYKKAAKKTLKSLFELYDGLKENPNVYSRSDDVLYDLECAIFEIGCSICPNEFCCIDDFRYWLNNN